MSNSITKTVNELTKHMSNYEENCDQNKEKEENDDEFYFESDHLALRGNADYRSVLRTIVILEAQKIEAAKHIDQIAETQRNALNDPEIFIKKLASGQSINLPKSIDIQNVSAVNRLLLTNSNK